MSNNFRELTHLPAKFVLFLIRVYQRCISPALGPRCRFYPTCSEYARLCVERQGLLIGGARTFARLCKCQPWHPGGVDVPFRDETLKEQASPNPRFRNIFCDH